MILRVKVIRGKKINVGDIKGMETYSVNALIHSLFEEGIKWTHCRGQNIGKISKIIESRCVLL